MWAEHGGCTSTNLGGRVGLRHREGRCKAKMCILKAREVLGEGSWRGARRDRCVPGGQRGPGGVVDLGHSAHGGWPPSLHGASRIGKD